MICDLKTAPAIFRDRVQFYIWHKMLKGILCNVNKTALLTE